MDQSGCVGGWDSLTNAPPRGAQPSIDFAPLAANLGALPKTWLTMGPTVRLTFAGA
jgi:hypothetical protein